MARDSFPPARPHAFPCSSLPPKNERASHPHWPFTVFACRALQRPFAYSLRYPKLARLPCNLIARLLLLQQASPFIRCASRRPTEVKGDFEVSLFPADPSLLRFPIRPTDSLYKVGSAFFWRERKGCRDCGPLFLYVAAPAFKKASQTCATLRPSRAAIVSRVFFRSE